MAGKAHRGGRAGRAQPRNSGRSGPPLRRTPWAVAIAAAMGTAGGQSALADNVIVPDGRTDTRLDIDGRTTDIRTNTVRGKNGFNSFHHFRVAPEHTVNLRLPDGTRNLINLVHDSRAVIDGTLNGVLDGRIGGHVVFADPHGIVVGASGVVNVGGLLLATPTQSFMDAVISPDGRIGEEAVDRLLAGEAPDSGEGVIRIDGEVNAAGAIAIEGTGVAVSGSLRSASPEARKALFEAAVNTEGLEEGFEIVQDGGVIAIRGEGDVTVDGTLDVAGIDDTDGGTVTVRAGRDVTLGQGARLDASGGAGTADGGTVDIWADRDAAVASGVRFDASAGDAGDGGFIEVSAAREVAIDGLDADLGAGAGGTAGEFLIDPITVAAGSTAYYTNGGDVTITASDEITLEADARINTRQVASGGGSTVSVADGGSPGDNPAGLADPAAADDPATASVGPSGSVTLTAPTITVGENAAILTFATGEHAAGDISLVAGESFVCSICSDSPDTDAFFASDHVGTPFTVASINDVQITVDSGAELDARNLDDPAKGGLVELAASASDLQVAGWSDAVAGITVNGALRGRAVSVGGSAEAGVDFGFLAGIDLSDPQSGIGALQGILESDSSEIGNNFLQNVDDPTDLTNFLAIGLPVTAGIATADVDVTIGAGAALEASETVSVTASGNRSVVGASGGALASQIPNLGLAAIYGQVSGETRVEVAGGARLSGATVTVNAVSDNAMEIAAEAAVERDGTTDGNVNRSAAFSLAIGRARVDTVSEVAANAGLTGSGDVTVRAAGIDSFSTGAASSAVSSQSGGTGGPQGAMTLAVSDWDTSAEAAFGASVSGLGSLHVVADNLSEGRVTKATVATGSGLFDYLLGAREDRKTALDGLLRKPVTRSGSPGGLRLAAAGAVTISEQRASARIGEDAVIAATGDVTVRSRVVDQGLRNVADSRVNSTAGSDAAKTSGSVAFAFGDYGHASEAVIGDGASVSGARVGVGARSELPIDNDYDEAGEGLNVTEWSGPADFLGAVDTVLGATAPDGQTVESFGLPDFLLTSYANAYGTAEQNAVFGSAGVTLVDHDTRAWVGEGAQVSASAADAEWTSDFPITPEREEDEAPDIDAAATWTWSAPVDVDARTTTETVGVTGNLSLLTLLTSVRSAGNSVGGSFAWNDYTSRTIAGVGDGAVVDAAALDVQADSRDILYAIAPSAGQGQSVAGNGIFSYASIDGTTHASIHNGARVAADRIDIAANHAVGLWAIGGAVAVSEETSIGAAIAANAVSTDTRAYVGDNADDRPLDPGETDSDGDGVADQAPGDTAVASGEPAALVTEALAVRARSQGRVGAIGVAAAVSRSGGQSGGDLGGSQRGTQGSRSASTQSATGNDGLGSALGQAGGALGAGGSQPTGKTTTLSAAGSGTLNFSRMNTVAEVVDAAIEAPAEDAASDLTVEAVTAVDQVSASGSAAVSLAGGQSSRSTALAGAVAFNDLDNQTRAGLYGVTASAAGRTDVLAASSGDVLSLGLALAAASGQQSTGAALSASVGMIDADSTAEIDDSTLTGTGEAASVIAYDRSRALVGGGALFAGGGSGGGGAGFAATYARIDNDLSAVVRASSLIGLSTLDVQALGASRMLAGALGAGVAGSGSTFTGGGSLYILTLESDLQAAVTGRYTLVDDDGDDTTPEVEQLQTGSIVTASGDVTVTASSTGGVAELDRRLTDEGGFDGQVDFAGSALDQNLTASADTGDDSAAVYDGTGSGEAVLGVAGALAAGGRAAAGLAIGFTDLRGSYVAELRDAAVTASNGSLSVTATNARQAVSVAVGASVGDSFSLLGSGAITLSETDVRARVRGASELVADQVTVGAGASGAIYSLAGSLSASSGGAAAGAAATYNAIGGQVTAERGGSATTTDGSDPAGASASVDVTAGQDADIRSAAIAGQFTSGSVALGGSATINELTTTTAASLSAGTVTADSVRVAARNGRAGDRTGIWSLAGNLTASNNVGVGGAFAFNTLGRSVRAGVTGTTFLGTDALTVAGTGASEVITLAVSGGAAGSVSAGVSEAVSTGTGTVSAGLDGIALVRPAARVGVRASDDSTIDSLAGAVQGGGTAAVGAALALNDLGGGVTASVSGGRLDVENALVAARSRKDIDTIAVGVVGSGSGSVSGSVAVNQVTSATRATIAGGAEVTAAHNVGVLAGSDDSVSIGAGSVAISGGVIGGAGSVTVNLLEGGTEAAIRGPGTRVEARGEDAADTVQASGGQLASVPSGNPFAALFGDGTGNLEAPGPADFAGYVAPDLAGASGSATGVVVDALALQQADTVVATAGVSADFVSGGTGVAGAVNTTVLGGSARALVEDAVIGDPAARDANGDVTLAAGHHAYGTNVMLGLGAGSAGGVGSVSVDTYAGEATAAIRRSDVYAGGAVTLDAVSRRDLLSVIAGLAVGTYGGVSGSGALAVFDGSTTAEITGAGETEAAGVDLHADSATEQDLIVAGLAGAGGFGGSGGLTVAVSESDTVARIGDGGARPEVSSDGAVRVDADAATRLNTVTAAAALAGGALSGAVGVQYLGNRTEASITGALVDAGGALDVTARDVITSDAVAGSAAIGGVAGGVGVNVGVMKSATVAELRASDVTTGGAVTVDASREVDVEVDTIVASASFGGAFAASGGVGVLLFGDSLEKSVHEDADGDLGKELGDENGEGSDGDWLDRADAFRDEDHLATEDAQGNTVDRTGGATDRLSDSGGGGGGGSSRFTGVREAVYREEDDGVSAGIHGGTLGAGLEERVLDPGTPDERTVTVATGAVSVSATDHLRTRNETVAVAAGGFVSAGGSVAVTQVNSDVATTVRADRLQAGSLLVGAASTDRPGAGQAVEVASYAGAAGLVGLGAAVGVGLFDAEVQAEVGGRVDVGGPVSVAANETASVNVKGLAAQAGALAAGVALGIADKGSTVTAKAASDTRLTAGSVAFGALAGGSLEAQAQAAAGGLGVALTGAVAFALDSASVGVTVASGAQLDSGEGSIALASRARSGARAETLGAAVAGSVSVGASVALARSEAESRLAVQSGARLAGASISLSALAGRGSGAGDPLTADARAVGANGGVLVGANVTVADAEYAAVTSAHVAQGAEIVAADGVTLTAATLASQRAEATGLSLGFLAVGASLADARSEASTTATFDADLTNGADLTVLADGDLRNRAASEAGSGGAIAGTAAEAGTSDRSSTRAELLSGGSGTGVRSRIGRLTVTARHRTDFSAEVDSVRASVVGASGAWAEHEIATDVDAWIGGDQGAARVDADDVRVRARTRLVKPARPADEFDVQSGSGGVVDAAAALGRTTITTQTHAGVADGAELHVVGDWRNPQGALFLSAENDFLLRDRVKLDSGGAIAVALAESLVDVQASEAGVLIGDATLSSVGALGLAAFSDLDIATSANAKTYGGAGAAQGSSLTRVDMDHRVEVGAGADLLGYGNVGLFAGRGYFDGGGRNQENDVDFESIAGARGRLSLRATTDLWNNTAFPISTAPGADSELFQDNRVSIAPGARVRSVSDVELRTSKGIRLIDARGTGKDLYREGASDVVGELVGNGEVSFEITGNNTRDESSGAVRVDGEAAAGIYSRQKLAFDELGEVVEQTEGITFTVGEGQLTQNLIERLQELYALKELYSGSAPEQAAFDAEIRFIRGRLKELTGQEDLPDDEFFVEANPEVAGAQLDPDGEAFRYTLFRIDDVIARPGNIEVDGDALVGGGVLDARGDARIDILNASPSFLELGDLIIPDDEGGQIVFNLGRVNTAAEIGSVNAAGFGAAAFGTVNTSATSAAPQILVENTYNPGLGIRLDLLDPDAASFNEAYARRYARYGELPESEYRQGIQRLRAEESPEFLPPDLTLLGDARNLNGNVTLDARYGSVVTDGNIRAGSVNISAGRDLVVGFTPGFTHIDGDPAGRATAEGARIAGNNVIISGRYLNLNGLIRSGIADWSVTLGAEAAARIGDFRESYQQARASGGSPSPRFTVLERDLELGRPGVVYDIEQDRLELDGIEVAGGYMELTGAIFSTGNGRLEVMDGYGRIDITNDTGFDLYLGQVDTGRGIEGTLRINDLPLDDTDVTRSTVYRRLGDRVTAETSEDGGETFTPVALDNADYGLGVREAIYRPVQGRQYVWLEASKKLSIRYRTDWQDKLFDVGAFQIGDGGNVTTRGPFEIDRELVEDGEYLSDNPDLDPGTERIELENWEETNRRSWNVCTDFFIFCLNRRYYVQVTEEQGINEVTRQLVAADDDVRIAFIGHDAGSLSVDSEGGVYLRSRVANAGGDVTITGDVIRSTSEAALIDAGNLVLRADNGIGDEAPLRVELGGTLDASTTRGGLGINAVNGALRVRQAVSGGGGTVDLAAQRDLGTVDASALIRGDRVRLQSRQGNVGLAGSAARVDSGSAEGDWLQASAAGDVRVLETAGDLRLDRIVAGGDVALTVADGGVIDVNTFEERDPRTEEELLALWEAMQLTGEAADAALATQIEAIQAREESAYQRYWALRTRLEDAAGPGGTPDLDSYEFRLSDAEKAVLREQRGLDADALAQIEAERTAEFAALHQRFGGAPFDPNFQYQLSAEELAAVSAGHQWTEEQLRFSVIGVPGGATRTDTVDELANLRGRNVTVDAAFFGNTLAEDAVIDLTGGVRALTRDERLALASAERDDITFSGPGGRIVTITQREDVDTESLGEVRIRADGDVFLGGERDFNVYAVDGGAVRITTDGVLRTARPDETVLSAGGDVILESAGVGSADSPFGTAIRGVLTARTAGAIHLAQNGALTVDNVLAEDGLWLAVRGGSLLAGFDGREALTGGAIDLDVDGDIGSGTRRLQVALGLDDALNLRAGGSAWIGGERQVGPSLQLADLLLGDLATGGDLDVADARRLQAAGDAAAIDAGGNLRLAATGDIGAGSRPLQVGANRVDAASDTGDVHLRFLRDSTGGALAALSGRMTLAAAAGAEADLDSVLALGPLAFGGAGGFDLGLVRSDASDLTADLGAAFDAAVLQLPAGRLDVEAGRSAIGAGTVAGTLSVVTGGVQDHGSLESGERMRLESGGAGVAFDTLLTAQAVDPDFLDPGPFADDPHEGIRVLAAGTAAGGDATAERDVRIEAGNIEVGAITSRGRDVWLLSGQDVITSRTSAARDLNIGAARDFVVDDGAMGADAVLEAGRNIRVTIGRDMLVRGIRAGNDVSLDVGGLLEFTFLEAGGDVDATSEAMRFDTIDAGGDVELDAVDDLLFTAIEAGGDVAGAAGGDLLGSRVEAGAGVDLAAGERLLLDEIGTVSGLSLAGRVIGSNWLLEIPDAAAGGDLLGLLGDPSMIRVRHEGSSLSGDLQGPEGGTADYVALAFEPAGALDFGRLYGERVLLSTSGSVLGAEDARVPDSLALDSAEALLYAHNRDPSVRDVDVQLYEPDGRFAFRVEGGGRPGAAPSLPATASAIG